MKPEPKAGGAAGSLPSLDGIRAVAFGLVFLSHQGLGNLIPGSFGVTIFFMLSGFLITTLMMQERERYGRVAIRYFYLRRFLRLTPPLLVVLAFALLLAAAGLTERSATALGVISILTYWVNYLMLFSSSFQIPAGLGVLWSLAVEEHFYLLWPWLFVLLAPLARPLMLRWMCLLLLLFLCWRIFLFVVLKAAPDYLLHASDTRMDSLLFGCLLALAWRRDPARESFQHAWADILLATTLLLITFLLRDNDFRGTLRFSLQGLAMLPLFYYAVRQPGLVCFRWLNHPVATYVGRRSYVLYLVHEVMLNLIQGQYPALPPVLAALLSLALSLAFAELCWRMVEAPLLPLRSRLRPR